MEVDQPQGRAHDPRHHRPGEGSTLTPKIRSDRARPACALLLAGLPFLAGACRSAREAEPAPAPERDSITLDSFRDLIQKGSLRPVAAMDADPAFADPAPDAAGEGFDAQARRIEEALSAGHPPAVPPPEPVVAENPYLRFGKRIIVNPRTGLITKPYPLRVGLGKRLEELLRNYGGFPLFEHKKDEPAVEQTPGSVRIELLEKWDQELFSDLRTIVPNDGSALNIADWLIVTAGPELLAEVESFIDIFAAGVPQIEIEAKIVEVTTTDTLDLGVKQVDNATPIFGFPDHTFVRSFGYSLPNTAGAINSLLTLGGVQDGLAFNAALQALASYDNVSIISRPKIAVREGGRASIVNTIKIPNLNVTGISTDGKYSAGVVYEEVGIKLYIVPRVVGTQTVALNIDIEASAQSGSAVVFNVASTGGSNTNASSVSNPIISRRAATTVVYLEPGQAVILGGLISERTNDAENKVPFLGDIPLLGYFFKSTYKRKEQTNVLFFIRPRILQGSDLNREF